MKLDYMGLRWMSGEGMTVEEAVIDFKEGFPDDYRDTHYHSVVGTMPDGPPVLIDRETKAEYPL